MADYRVLLPRWLWVGLAAVAPPAIYTAAVVTMFLCSDLEHSARVVDPDTATDLVRVLGAGRIGVPLASVLVLLLPALRDWRVTRCLLLPAVSGAGACVVLLPMLFGAAIWLWHAVWLSVPLALSVFGGVACGVWTSRALTRRQPEDFAQPVPGTGD